MDVYENLKAHGLTLTESLSAAGMYKPVNQTGNLVFISGQGSIDCGRHLTGRVGVNVTLEEAQYAAKGCVKILGFVAGADDFTDQAKVINGASEVFIAAFGEEGRHARSAIGTNSLPLGLTVEVESIFEIE